MGAPGIYVSSRQGLIVSELDPAGLNDPGRIAAHEPGHSLTRLEPAQIEDARKQAQFGGPVASL
jgi:hypothetical protein